MAKEFRHKDVIDGRTSEAEFEHINQHKFNDQATGDIMIANSADGLAGLAIGATTDMPLTIGATGIPQWGGDVVLGSDKLLFTTTLLKELYAGTIAARNLADDAFCVLRGSWIEATSGIRLATNGGYLDTSNADNHFARFRARANTVGLTEVARFQSAADPYFQLGPAAGALRVSAAKVIQIDLDGSLETVSLGAADSGGAGYMLLRIPNT